MHKVFVYGSLKRGFHNHILLENRNTKYLGESWTTPNYTMLSLGGFPAVLGSGKTAILGEVFEVDDKVLSHLDTLEGHPSWYKRELIQTEYGDSYIYLMGVNHATEYMKTATVVESGVWLDPYKQRA